MAAAAVGSSASAAVPDTDPPIRLDHLRTVDLRGMSQAELYALSKCTPSGFDPLRCDDVVIPKIDRSVFNESAGSRKQTYSRLRLAPASSAASGSQPPIRRRTPHLRHGGGVPYHYMDSEPEKGENQQIVSLFKQLFGVDGNVVIDEPDPEQLVPIRVEYSPTEPLMAEQIGTSVPITVEPAQLDGAVPVGVLPALQSGNAVPVGMKRKRGRPRKNAVPLALVENIVEVKPVSPVNNQSYQNAVQPYLDMDREIINKDGLEVDLVAMGGMLDPYEPELMRRTRGMVTEEELLDFLGSIDGRWGTRRNKRRIVDANEFGNVLPNGWTLLLAVKKKDGHCWVVCRRYISPSGRQFETCKDISSYLLSLRGMPDSNQPPFTQSNTLTESVSGIVSDNTVDVAAGDQAREVNPAYQVASSATAPESSTFPLEATPLKTEDLPAVQVEEVTHCVKCNTSFPSQDDYFQHQLSSHRRKKPKSGHQSITDGVIIRDGKFECQFCHKTFIERHRYNGHVGAHVRYQGKGSDELLAPPAFNLVSQGTLSGADADHAPNPYSPCGVSKQQGEFKESTDGVAGVREELDANATKSSSPLNSEAFPCSCENNDCFGTHDDATITKTVVGGTDNGIEILGGTDTSEGLPDEVVVSNNKFSDTLGMVTESYPSFSVEDKTCGSSEMQVTGISVDTEQDQQKTVLGSDLLGSKENLVTSDIDLGDVPLSDRNYEPRFESEKYVPDVSVCDFDDNDGGLDLCSGIGVQQHLASEDQICKNGDNLDDKPMYPDLGSEGNLGSGYNSTGVTFEDENLYTFAGMDSGKSGNHLPSFANFELNTGLQQYADGGSARQTEESKGSEVHYLTEEDLMFSFNSSTNPKKLETQANRKPERSLEFRTFFPSQSAEDSVASFHTNVLEERKNQHFLADSLVPGASHQTYGVENIYATQVEQSNDGRNSKAPELCLSSDSRYPSEGYGPGSGMKQMMGLPGFSDRNFGFGNMMYPDKVWETPKIDAVGNSSRNFMAGFDGISAQPVQNVMPGSVWRTGEQNLFNTGSSINSAPPVQSSSSFCNFDIISNKGEGLYGVNQKYDAGIGFESLRLGRTQPIEYSFMTGQGSSSSTLPGKSKGFPYDVNTGGFDSSFWLGREALMPNPRQVSVQCVWCRSEFYQDPLPTGAQTGGAIGSMCPDCSSKVSSQFNV